MFVFYIEIITLLSVLVATHMIPKVTAYIDDNTGTG
jgi:hypothetical protein